jgi:AcrR family transcriptional regulator
VTQTSSRATDPRPARTRAAIRNAARSLAAEQAEVTINAIASAAGISRTAFYSHFDGLDALALDMLVREFERIGAVDVAARDAASEDVSAIARRAAERLTRHIDAERDFYRTTLDWRLTSESHEVLVTAFARVVASSMGHLRAPVPPGLDADGHALYIAGGAVTLLRRWVRSAEPVPAEQMTEQLLSAMPSWLVGERKTEPRMEGNES